MTTNSMPALPTLSRPVLQDICNNLAALASSPKTRQTSVPYYLSFLQRSHRSQADPLPFRHRHHLRLWRVSNCIATSRRKR